MKEQDTRVKADIFPVSSFLISLITFGIITTIQAENLSRSLVISVSFCTVNVKAKDQSCKAFWLNNPGLFIGACATAPCMLYTLYKPFTCYLLFCPVGVSGRRYTLPERS